METGKLINPQIEFTCHQPGYAAWLGIFNTSRMSGVVVGPLVAGLTADAYGVNGDLAIFAAIAAAVTLLTLAVREPLRPCTERDLNVNKAGGGQ